MSAALRTRAEAYLALADAATPGPWREEFTRITADDSCGNVTMVIYDEGGHSCADAVFIAASHEGAALIRSLLADNEALRRDAEALLRDARGDAERGDDKSIGVTSGGERIWLNEALTRAIALFRAEQSGRQYGCLFSDESDGALDDDRKVMFVQMKRRVMERGGFTTELFISHTPALWELADHVIDVGAMKEAA